MNPGGNQEKSIQRNHNVTQSSLLFCCYLEKITLRINTINLTIPNTCKTSVNWRNLLNLFLKQCQGSFSVSRNTSIVPKSCPQILYQIGIFLFYCLLFHFLQLLFWIRSTQPLNKIQKHFSSLLNIPGQMDILFTKQHCIIYKGYILFWMCYKIVASTLKIYNCSHFKLHSDFPGLSLMKCHWIEVQLWINQYCVILFIYEVDILSFIWCLTNEIYW